MWMGSTPPTSSGRGRRWQGEKGSRPVGDIDVLVLGHPDRDRVYEAAHDIGLLVGREVQVQIRATDWLREGTGSFHDTVLSRPMVQVLPDARSTNDVATSTARSAS